MKVKAALIFFGALLYATIRYIGFGGVDPIHIPVYVLNKAVSVAAVIFFAVAAGARLNALKPAGEPWRTAALHCTFVHVLLSLTILSPAYFPKFFGPDKLNLTGELTLALGAGAALCLKAATSAASRRAWGLLGQACVAGHVFVMGYRGWLTVAKWPGRLPPISLLSFLGCLLCLGLSLWSDRGRSGN